MFSRNLTVPDFVRRFFVSCAQISEAYAVRTVMKFGCDWQKTGHKGRYRKDSERTSDLYKILFIRRATLSERYQNIIRTFRGIHSACISFTLPHTSPST